MDKVDWAIEKFRNINEPTFKLPFTEACRQAHVDPLETAPRLRNRRQHPKNKHGNR